MYELKAALIQQPLYRLKKISVSCMKQRTMRLYSIVPIWSTSPQVVSACSWPSLGGLVLMVSMSISLT